MLHELSVASGAQGWAIGSMLFFIAAFSVIVVRALRRKREDLARLARLPLDDEPPAPGAGPAATAAASRKER